MSRISSMARFRLAAGVAVDKEEQQEMGFHQMPNGRGMVRRRSKSSSRLLDTFSKGHFFTRLVTAFEHTSSYDESITGYMRRQFGGNCTNGSPNNRRLIPLRYGTNPHQSQEAELYSLQTDMPIKVNVSKNLGSGHNILSQTKLQTYMEYGLGN
uniref:Uncharacterized protein n=1 Tax=Ditylenchus dipsaci TaxID=166011 RepID=A0A915EAV2_9BILA